MYEDENAAALCCLQLQQIDGEAFLLLTQVDLVKIMCIKLGPALKIYNSILMFKTAENSYNELERPGLAVWRMQEAAGRGRQSCEVGLPVMAVTRRGGEEGVCAFPLSEWLGGGRSWNCSPYKIMLYCFLRSASFTGMGQQRPDGRTERGWKRAAPINIDTQSGEKKRQTPSDKDSEGTGVREDPVGLVQLPNTYTNTIVAAIRDIITGLTLQMADCHGQGHDGASNFQGNVSGVAKEIQGEAPSATPVHGLAHCLNLTLQDIAQKCKRICDAFDFAAVNPLNSSQLPFKANRHLCRMPIKQQRHARMTERHQTEAEFEQFYSGVVKKSEGMTDPPVQPCYKRIHQKLVSGSENHRHTDVKVYYRQQYYEVLDSVTGELVRRFDQKNFLVLMDIEAILLSAANGKDCIVMSQ
ncbi:UNVERIFIED_CONTAM: hypothetical protein FKN15_050465 [Acipenser sinensis]